MIANTFVLFGLNLIFGNTVTKKKQTGVAQAVKIGNKNERIHRELTRWISERRIRALQRGINTSELIDHDERSARFVNLLKIAEDMLQLGGTCSYWLVFDDFIDESDYIQLVQIDASGIEETRVTISR